MDDNNKENGRSFLDDVVEKGNLGLMLAFFRQCTKAEEWPARREALVKVLEQRGYKEDTHLIVDSSLLFVETANTEGKTASSIEELETESLKRQVALVTYFGLAGFDPMSVSEVAAALNKEFKSIEYTKEKAGVLIGNGLRILGEYPLFRSEVEIIADEADRISAA